MLIAGGGTTSYDIINIVGGMQKPLVDNNLVQPIDLSQAAELEQGQEHQRIPRQGHAGLQVHRLQRHRLRGADSPARRFLRLSAGKDGQADSYAALFDPKWKGYVALEDNYTTAGQKTALYLKHANLAKISNPDDMTPEEFKTVVDFLIDQKKKGQFRVIWSSFEQAVDLIVNKEVYVIDCWEPMVFVAKSKGVDAIYADPTEGYLLWAMAAYVTNNPNRSAEQTAAAYELLNFILGGWYGAKITTMRGYMTNTEAPDYAKQHSDEFPADAAQKVVSITENVRRKFGKGGVPA